MKPRRYSIDAPDQRRLKIARLEIEAILKKHDLAGVVVLHTPGMAEVFYDVEPSYSCLRINDKAGEVRVRSKLADYGGDTAAQRLGQAATANMAASLADSLGHVAVMFMEVAEVVDRATKAEHTETTYVADPDEQRRQ
jgi:hypothetical protein